MDDIKVGAGLTGLSISVGEGHPLADKRLRVESWLIDDDGSLDITFREDPAGVRFSKQASNPGTLQSSETWGAAKARAQRMPRFGKTVSKIGLIKEGHYRVTVPTKRAELIRRGPRARAAEIVETSRRQGPTRDEFAAAVKAVNAYKARLGTALELRVAEDGTLRGAIMEEFS